MEPTAYHKADEWNDDDSASTDVRSGSFMEELRIKVRKVETEVSTIIGTETKIVKQVLETS